MNAAPEPDKPHPPHDAGEAPLTTRQRRSTAVRCLRQYGVSFDIAASTEPLAEYPGDHPIQEETRLLAALGPLLAVVLNEMHAARMRLMHAPLPEGAAPDPAENCPCGCAHTVAPEQIAAAVVHPQFQVVRAIIADGEDEDESFARTATAMARLHETALFFQVYDLCTTPDASRLGKAAICAARAYATMLVGLGRTGREPGPAALASAVTQLEQALAACKQYIKETTGLDVDARAPDDLSALNRDPAPPAADGPSPEER